MKLYIGIDDTDNKVMGGTGRLAREIAAELRQEYEVRGVSRHQLLVDDRVPYTSRNSCNVIHLTPLALPSPQGGKSWVEGRAESLRALAVALTEPVRCRSLPGSDPGLCIASEEVAGHSFGRKVQTDLSSQAEAVAVAEELGVPLIPLGGTGDGIIGALAGVILAAGGNSGRFVEVGRVRELDGVVEIQELLASGVDEVRSPDGARVTDGRVDTCGGRVRPSIQHRRTVLLVQPVAEGKWRVAVPARGKKKER
ncbi:MAG: hypothetical protein AUJ92_10325 [Armatimonadetes bacterium CG2_30_59_28]|nr:MAG: hypothetical protein AUJ92_10325 [Armatimonadetes bacterium CG2_30_59_28]PIU60933.1 MAG: ABC transporter substrate-binding protein [Armatimonadetes bacterium CG07_land_8_20_14_0_80_59_28]